MKRKSPQFLIRPQFAKRAQFSIIRDNLPFPQIETIFRIYDNRSHEFIEEPTYPSVHHAERALPHGAKYSFRVDGRWQVRTADPAAAARRIARGDHDQVDAFGL